MHNYYHGLAQNDTGGQSSEDSCSNDRKSASRENVRALFQCNHAIHQVLRGIRQPRMSTAMRPNMSLMRIQRIAKQQLSRNDISFPAISRKSGCCMPVVTERRYSTKKQVALKAAVKMSTEGEEKRGSQMRKAVGAEVEYLHNTQSTELFQREDRARHREGARGYLRCGAG